MPRVLVSWIGRADLIAQANIMAAREVPALIHGETGTGKELFATAIHNASARQSKQFVPVNCGAIPRDLIDATLFGHVKGAFTGAATARIGYFEEADGGTLLLDEQGELTLDAQVRLLRVLQTGDFYPVGGTASKHVDVRMIAATNRPAARVTVVLRRRNRRTRAGSRMLPRREHRAGNP